MATYLPIAKASFTQSASYTYFPLRTDGDDITSRSGTIASGTGVLKAGTICKIVPASGVITVGATAPEANCILADDYDATSATVPALVYTGGKFNAAAVIWPGALNHGDVTDALRNYGIFIESAVYTDGTLVKSAPKDGESAGAQAVVESNRADAEAARAAAPAPAAAEVKPSIDSPWAYLTAEEREKSPELAAVPTAAELAAAVPPEGPGGTPGPVTPVTITPTSGTVLASGGTGSVAVTMTGTGTWTASTGVPWVTLSPAGPQSASGSVTYTAAVNTTGLPRQAPVSINGQTFTVNQGAV